MPARPKRTRAQHTLPFERLSPPDFERLCLRLLAAEGFERVEHLGAAGADRALDRMVAVGASGYSSMAV